LALLVRMAIRRHMTHHAEGRVVPDDLAKKIRN
jgi:hypothetical protein